MQSSLYTLYDLLMILVTVYLQCQTGLQHGLCFKEGSVWNRFSKVLCRNVKRSPWDKLKKTLRMLHGTKGAFTFGIFPLTASFICNVRASGCSACAFKNTVDLVTVFFFFKPIFPISGKTKKIKMEGKVLVICNMLNHKLLHQILTSSILLIINLI